MHWKKSMRKEGIDVNSCRAVSRIEDRKAVELFELSGISSFQSEELDPREKRKKDQPWFQFLPPPLLLLLFS